MRAHRCISSLQAAGVLTIILLLIAVSDPAKAVTCGLNGAKCSSPGAYSNLSATSSVTDTWKIRKFSKFYAGGDPNSTQILGDLNTYLVPLDPIDIPNLIGATDVKETGGITRTGVSTHSGTFTLTDNAIGSAIWGVRYGNSYLLLVFAEAIQSLTLTVPDGITDVFAFNLVGTHTLSDPPGTPLPSALSLLGTVLGAGFLISRWRRKPRSVSPRRVTLSDLTNT